ncbi:MAG: TetR/AcrR family transcriptional regulator [Promethearchaeota archaeon]|nr:MAG: TetR/AcrR family transcriptional regulator [Candidatus Lokiarchaeota archaeon]
MSPRFKQTRARSEEDKAEQFERILEAGKELFLKKGTMGFSMRNLAEMLDMTKNNLYNYVESKRELWIAIRNKFYNQFKEENLEIIKNHKGDTCELVLKLYEHFLDFADRDYDKFKMMFNVVEAPHSNKVGPIEKKYREYRLLDGTTKLIHKGIEKGEINGDSASLLSLLSYSFTMGVAYIEMNRSLERTPNKVWETIQLSRLDVSKEEFKEKSLKVLESMFRSGI